MNLVAIDPGRTTGWASFRDGVLSVAQATEPRMLLAYAFRDESYLTLIENPRWYPHDHKDVNDLIDLAVLVGEYKRYYESEGCRVELVWPRTWKGNVPKDVTNRRTIEHLTADELAVLPRRSRRAKLPYDHNMLDAVGLGLWKLGRLR